MARWQIKNIVVSVDLGVTIPLEKLAIELPNAEYNPEQFPGLILRFEKDTPALLIFNSGRVNITGSKSMEEVKEAIEKLRKILQEMGIKVPENYKMTVQNIVVSGYFDVRSIDLLRMVEELDNVQYDPEQFPGAIVKYGPVTFLVFRTGKFVCTGAKSKEEAEEYIKKFEEEVIKKYAKQ